MIKNKTNPSNIPTVPLGSYDTTVDNKKALKNCCIFVREQDYVLCKLSCILVTVADVK